MEKSPPRILAVSSFVAHGTVGLRAIGPALTSLGCEAIELPTVVLSNHPGHAYKAGEPVDTGLLTQMTGALQKNGWLENLSAIVTGYLPTAEHVEAVQEAVILARRESPKAPYILDPILGDDPKGLYIDHEAAAAIRDRLLALADTLTPNRFELEWLTGLPVINVDGAVTAARTLLPKAVVATSIPAPDGQLATVLVTPDDVMVRTTAKLPVVPHGTGDLLAGLFTAHLSRGAHRAEAFNAAHALLMTVISTSINRDRLDLSPLTASANLT